jgi:hypothetical protein
MTDEVRIDEVILNQALKLVDVGGECEHRLLYHLIAQIAEMGHRWRSEYKIVLFNGEAEAEFDEEYADYLDLRAQKKKVEWTKED